MLEDPFGFAFLRIVFALIMLAIASVWDLWKREVSDLLWIGFAIIAVILIFLEPNILITLENIGISLIIAPLAIVLWRFGMFGGADALGLMVLSALAPHATFSNGIITPFSTLTNAAILSTAPLFANIIRNLVAISQHNNIFEGFKETRLKKVIAMFVGYKARNPRYSFSIEKTEGNDKKLDFALHHAENAEFCTTSNTWVTPGIPYMLYIAAGFVVQLFFGDIIFNTFRIV